MKRRTGYLNTSAGTITTGRPLGALARMMGAQERDRAIDKAQAHARDEQAGGADKPRE